MVADLLQGNDGAGHINQYSTWPCANKRSSGVNTANDYVSWVTSLPNRCDISDLDLQAHGLWLCLRRRRTSRYGFASPRRHCTSSRLEFLATRLTELRRYRYTTLEPLSDVSLAVGLATRSDVCVQLLLEPPGRFWVLRCNAQLRTTFG